MRPVRLVLPALAALALTGAAKPKEPAKDASGDEVLVLGLRAKDGSLSTWLADASGLKNVGSGLAVPRADGWWRLERVERESKTSHEKRHFAFKAGQKFVPPPLDVEEGCESALTETLLFAGPESFSIETASSGDCEGAAHGYSSVVIRTVTFDDTTRTTDRPVERVFGAEAAKAWQTAAARAHGGEEKRQLDCLSDAEPTDVALVRQKGRWILRGELNYAAEACRGTYEYFTVDTSISDKITGPDKLPHAFDAYLESRPALKDAVASPSGRLELFVDSEGVELLSEGKPLVRVEEPESAIVLAQWALGKSAAKWRADVPKALSPGK